jgi:hypothetical protein
VLDRDRGGYVVDRVHRVKTKRWTAVVEDHAARRRVSRRHHGCSGQRAALDVARDLLKRDEPLDSVPERRVVEQPGEVAARKAREHRARAQHATELKRRD